MIGEIVFTVAFVGCFALGFVVVFNRTHKPRQLNEDDFVEVPRPEAIDEEWIDFNRRRGLVTEELVDLNSDGHMIGDGSVDDLFFGLIMTQGVGHMTQMNGGWQVSFGGKVFWGRTQREALELAKEELESG